MTAVDSHAQDHGHGHDHPPFLAHHWANPKQQFEAGKLGMWLFLATEFLLFGGLFCAYAVYRHNHPEIFAWGSQFLDTKWGAINTVVLILSSLTMAMAVTASQKGNKNALIGLLALTFVGGAGFMGIKYIEYKHKFEHNIVWGTGLYQHSSHDAPFPEAATLVAAPSMDDANGKMVVNGVEIPRTSVASAGAAPTGLAPGALSDEKPAETAHDAPHEDESHTEVNPRTDPNRPANAHIFFGIYFCMTGLHGFHVLVGMIVMLWLMKRAMQNHFSAAYFTPVDLGGLYWHVVDLIWIFLFPLLYLI